MFWRWQSLPELKLYSKSQREALWGEAQRDPLRLIDVVSLLTFAAIMVAFFMASFATPKQPAWLSILMLGLCWFGVNVAMGTLMILRYRPSLRRVIERRTSGSDLTLMDRLDTAK
ncbi:MAG: hypothetical protein JWM57_4191 [Phycisphaerales bacterium]|nr:hypothetical protein [Phycisphaerales bacterium]